MPKTYKLFVWDSVFCDYSCGIAFAVARDETEARELLRKQLPDYLHHDIEKKPQDCIFDQTLLELRPWWLNDHSWLIVPPALPPGRFLQN